jgi:hypothetical protein
MEIVETSGEMKGMSRRMVLQVSSGPEIRKKESRSEGKNYKRWFMQLAAE